MKKFLVVACFAAVGHACFSQVEGTINTVLLQPFTVEKSIAATPVKNQANTLTCWCFSTTSLVESQCLKKNLGEMDISEMFTVRNIYIEKAKNYLLRQGHAQFGEGGLGHDLIRAIATYGAIPENVYSGLKSGQKMHNHGKLVVALQQFLDSVLKLHPVPQNWLAAYTEILDQALGQPPVSFDYNGKQYTPVSFSKELLKFDANEYVNITSFTHHPYYQPFIIEVPDNFSNGSYYNLPLDEMIQVTKNALKAGYSILWDADVSNGGFMQGLGAALYYDSTAIKNDKYAVSRGKAEESKWDATIRQALYENLTTQDDHLMHITGLEKSPEGKTFFIVKNSWGNIGPSHGYINVSEAYFAINTISLIIPKAGLSKELLTKLGIK